MSTTFAIKLPNGTMMEVAYRSNGIRWINVVAEMLSSKTEVYALDNASNGINTIGDIKKAIKLQEVSKEHNYAQLAIVQSEFALLDLRRRFLEKQMEHYYALLFNPIFNTAKSVEDLAEVKASFSGGGYSVARMDLVHRYNNACNRLS